MLHNNRIFEANHKLPLWKNYFHFLVFWICFPSS